MLDTAAAGGFRFTLRRVFYALVSAEVLPNTERAYKNLSETLKRARLKGLLPLDCLDDLGRVAAVPPSWETAVEALTALAHQYRSDWWQDADPYVEVWAEKAAVSGIVAPLANEYGVTFLACRGFSSLTAIAESVGRFRGRASIVLYVGDHDPSGLDMDRDLQCRLRLLGADVELQRLALTVEQIDHHQLPPQPTKQSDSRTSGYDHSGSWEADLQRRVGWVSCSVWPAATPMMIPAQTAASVNAAAPLATTLPVELSAADRARVDAALRDSRAANTRAQYRSAWRGWSEWAALAGHQALPADPLAIAAYLAERVDQGAAAATVRTIRAAIRAGHVDRHRRR